MAKDNQSYRAPLTLRAGFQQYAWGKRGADSAVAALLPQFDSDRPYAELWIGAHPTLPSQVIDGDAAQALDKLIAEDPLDILGERVAGKFSNTLPFLLKVLSVGSALSIQAHPDKALAEKLNREKPEHYPDKNHKPEMAIALTPSSLLYGFRSSDEVSRMMDQYAELSEFLGDRPRTLPDVHRAFVTGDAVIRSKCIKLLSERFVGESSLNAHQQLFLSLCATYGASDSGILTSLLMNIVELAPGKAIYIAAKIPHAYLSGDLIECMANSDNVVRAGLTNKYQDVETLLSMLDYGVGMPTLIEPLNGIYKSPAAEFELMVIDGGKGVTFNGTGEVATLLCLEGIMTLECKDFKKDFHKGSAVLVPAAARDIDLKTSAHGKVVVASVPFGS